MNISAKLLAWYRRVRRELPWRTTDGKPHANPYAVWISEIMLQQTRVETVIPYYERWMAKFPTVAALAKAPTDDVLAVWAGLGYYSRARNLKSGAELICREHRGTFPSNEAGVRGLPGVGRYTTGAILSIAFGQSAPLVDGNVARVLSRLFVVEEDIKSAAGQTRLWQLATELVPRRNAGDHNQALMELGATICTPKHPLCDQCPVAAACLARAQNRQAELPTTAKAKDSPTVTWVSVRIVARDRVVMGRRPPRGLWGGLWEFPSGEANEGEAVEAAAQRIVTERTGLRLIGIEPVHAFDHVLSHRRLRIHLFEARAEGTTLRASFYDDAKWVHRIDAHQLGVAAWMKPLLPTSPPSNRRKRA